MHQDSEESQTVCTQLHPIVKKYYTGNRNNFDNLANDCKLPLL